MATNEINKYGHWLSVPVRDDAQSGDPVVFGGRPGVVQVAYTPEREPIPGYVALPAQSGFNLSGQELENQDMLPEGTKFASVAFIGVWAFEIEGDSVTFGDAVYYDGGTDTLSLTGDTLFGHVVNRGTDGRLHVLLASTTGA